MNNSNVTPGVSPPATAPPLDVNKLVDKYVQLRDRKRQLEQQHKDQLQPYNEVLDTIEGTLLNHLQQTGSNSIATPGGTVYQSTQYRATIRDGAAFRSWVIAHAAYEMVDWRANANAVFDHIKTNNGVSPPGVNTSTFTKVGIRRPNDKD